MEQHQYVYGARRRGRELGHEDTWIVLANPVRSSTEYKEFTELRAKTTHTKMLSLYWGSPIAEADPECPKALAAREPSRDWKAFQFVCWRMFIDNMCSRALSFPFWAVRLCDLIRALVACISSSPSGQKPRAFCQYW